MEKIGIIAGNGSLPTLVAFEAKRSGLEVHVCGVKGEASASLERVAASLEWVELGQLGRLIRYFKGKNVSRVVMAGKITKTNLFKGEIAPDIDMIKAVSGLRDRKDNSLLSAVAGYLEKNGIRLMSSIELIPDSLPRRGVPTKRKPNKNDREEIDFAWQMAKQVAALDIGQTVVTKNKAILAVEAIEGTDEAIRRGGELGGGGVTVVKVAKPKQDLRFDVPTVGLTTLESLIRAKARTLAFESEKTILLDHEQFLKKADQHHLIVVSL